MTSRSYFGKMNSTLGSVVPLAMFKSHSFNGPLIRVKNIAVRERGSKVVLDLGVAYNGDAFLGVSLMKVASHETEI